MLSAEQRNHVKLMVTVIITFRSCGVGSPEEQETPVRLLRSLQGSNTPMFVTTTLRELENYTHSFVERHRVRISAEYAKMCRRYSRPNLKLANSVEGIEDKKERNYARVLDQANRNMEVFLNTYPAPPSADSGEHVGLPAESALGSGGPKAMIESTDQQKLSINDESKTGRYMSPSTW